MSKHDLALGDQSRWALLAEAESAADLLARTFSPKGSSVGIYQDGILTLSCDGAFVAEGLASIPRYRTAGASLTCQAALDARRIAGDGAVTAAILFVATLKEAGKWVDGRDPRLFQLGIEKGVEATVGYLNQIKRRISEEVDLISVARTASDEEIGDVVGRAWAKAGASGTVEAIHDPDCRKLELDLSGDSRAVIRLGTYTQREADEKLLKIGKAVRSCKSALSHGVVPGGTSALIGAIPVLEDMVDHPLPTLSPDQQFGVRALIRAYQEPLLRASANARGTQGFKAVTMVRRAPQWSAFDVREGEVVEAQERGILDSLHVLTTALEVGGSLAGVAINLNALVSESPAGEPEHPAEP